MEQEYGLDDLAYVTRCSENSHGYFLSWKMMQPDVSLVDAINKFVVNKESKVKK